MLPNLVKKTKQTYAYTITSFNLGMFKGAHDVFALIVNFLRDNQMSKHITIGLFEASKTLGQTFARSFKAIYMA